MSDLIAKVHLAFQTGQVRTSTLDMTPQTDQDKYHLSRLKQAVARGLVKKI
jgi:hypothetical protein